MCCPVVGGASGSVSVVFPIVFLAKVVLDVSLLLRLKLMQCLAALVQKCRGDLLGPFSCISKV